MGAGAPVATQDLDLWFDRLDAARLDEQDWIASMWY